MELTFRPIAFVRSSRKEYKDTEWDKEQVYIELNEEFESNSLKGLEEFSHIEVIFYFHKVHGIQVEYGANHPRNNLDLPQIGVFAQRSKGHPNKLGSCVCQIDKIVDTKIYLNGLDAIEGTPVLDIKPWIFEFGPRGKTRQPEWVDEVMKNYWS